MFNILHTNICSLNANLENLELLLNNLEHSFDIIAVSETWTPKNNHTTHSKRNITGYQKYHGIEGSSLKSGCGFYIKGNIRFKPRNDLSISYVDDKNEFQSCWIEILLDNDPNILIGVFYRHPKKASDNTFLEQLKCSLSKIKSRSKHIILCGDFNYQPCITEPTQIVPGNRPSLVYNTFINNIDKNLHTGNLLDKLTDHIPNFVIIENMNKKTSKQKIKVRDMIHFTPDKHLADPKDLDSVLLQDFSNVNDMFKSYQRKKHS